MSAWTRDTRKSYKWRVCPYFGTSSNLLQLYYAFTANLVSIHNKLDLCQALSFIEHFYVICFIRNHAFYEVEYTEVQRSLTLQKIIHAVNNLAAYYLKPLRKMIVLRACRAED